MYHKDCDILKNLLQKDFWALFFWKLRRIKPKKSHIYIFRNTEFEFDNLSIENSREVVLGVTIDNKLTFDSHIKNICRTVGQKLGAFLRITNYFNSSQKKLLYLAKWWNLNSVTAL